MVNDIMTKTIATTQISPLIPEEVFVYEILKRLPVKTLCRFKAVSKRWLSIINSRPFIDLHFQHSKLNPTRLLVFYNDKDTTTNRHPPILFSTTNSADQTSSSSYNYWPDRYYRWFSISPRGLICFYNILEDRAVQIWNPSTGEHIELNHPTRKLGKRRPLFLGFDPVSKKHKLLSSSNSDNYVFTLGDNKWRKISDNGSSNLHPTLWGDYCIDGIVYYLARCDQNDPVEKVLMRFDIGSEKFLEPIHLPGELVRFPRHGKYSGIYIYRGRILLLNLVYVHPVTYGYQMWVLENDHKWSPKRLIPPEPPVPENNYSVGFIDGEELILYSSELDANSEGRSFRLCSYDLEKRRGWTETIFPDLKGKLDVGSAARYDVSFYYYVNTLEPLKPH